MPIYVKLDDLTFKYDYHFRSNGKLYRVKTREPYLTKSDMAKATVAFCEVGETHAHWEEPHKFKVIKAGSGEVYEVCQRRCSRCQKWSKLEFVFDYPSEYCCHCGAKMDEEAE